jgi:hypothetical protein
MIRASWSSSKGTQHGGKNRKHRKPTQEGGFHPARATPVAPQTRPPTGWMQPPKRCGMLRKTSRPAHCRAMLKLCRCLIEPTSRRKYKWHKLHWRLSGFPPSIGGAACSRPEVACLS